VANLPENLPPRPPLTITVGDKTYKMTYGLEMDLRRLLPDLASALTLIATDAYIQDYVLRRVLTDKNQIITDPNLLIMQDEVTLDSEEIEQVLSWATEHALYFFMRRTLEVGKLGVRYQSALQMPSKDGSETSASTTPSAGLSV
jgi:hypothetical protein